MKISSIRGAAPMPLSGFMIIYQGANNLLIIYSYKVNVGSIIGNHHVTVWFVEKEHPDYVFHCNRH